MNPNRAWFGLCVVAFILLLSTFYPPYAYGEMLWSTGATDLEVGFEPKDEGRDTAAEGLPARGQAIASLVTTSSRLVRAYPADAVNYFYKGRHKVVHFYAYLLFTPPAPISHKITNEWIDTNGEVFCRKEITVQPSYPDDVVRVGDETYLYYLFMNHVGLESVVEAAGQERVPSETGRYAIRLMVDGQQKALTFFRILENTGTVKLLPSSEDFKNSILPEPFRRYIK